jgi:hypothetical protein
VPFQKGNELDEPTRLLRNNVRTEQSYKRTAG